MNGIWCCKIYLNKLDMNLHKLKMSLTFDFFPATKLATILSFQIHLIAM